jgi:hypothetical protein
MDDIPVLKADTAVLKSDMNLMKWMVGFVLAPQVAIASRLFILRGLRHEFDPQRLGRALAVLRTLFQGRICCGIVTLSKWRSSTKRRIRKCSSWLELRLLREYCFALR